jgi:hypothetical protein
VTRSHKKAAKRTPPVIDPYIPANGNFGYRVSRYELDLEYKVNINRLSGTATITAATLASLKTFTLDLSDVLMVSKVLVNGHRPQSFHRSRCRRHCLRERRCRSSCVTRARLGRSEPSGAKSVSRS